MKIFIEEINEKSINKIENNLKLIDGIINIEISLEDKCIKIYNKKEIDCELIKEKLDNLELKVIDIIDSSNELVVGGIYRHFKGNIYKVINVGFDSETLDELVIYQDINNGKIWVRKKDMFLSKTDKNKYPNITQEYRFELIK